MSKRDDPPALLCGGPHCRGEARERLCDALNTAGIEVLTSRCLGVCKGPVALLPIGDRWEVVARVRNGQARRKVVIAMRRQRRGVVQKRAVGGARRRRAIARGALTLARSQR